MQYDCIEKMGMSSIWYTTDDSYKSHNFCRKLEMSFITRFRQIFNFFKKNREEIHHLEIYPGGKFSGIYAILARYFKLKIICAERGDLLYYKPKYKGGYSLLTRFSMLITYKLAHVVWYREFYMLEILKRIGVKQCIFIPNGIKVSDEQNKKKDLDFLWVNRVIPERNANWFVQNLSNDSFSATRNVLIGLLFQETKYKDLEQKLIEDKPDNLELLSFSNPKEYYQRSKFFVLPARIVYVNNSLLEAMSFGVIPLVSDTQESDKIVINGVNGFVFENSQEAFLDCMQKVSALSKEEYESISKAARAKIIADFSDEVYLQRLEKMYTEI